MFIETFNKDYHLIVMQKIYQQSIIFQKTLNSSSQCLHINQLFNETMRNYTLLRRIKYYHSPCQKNLSLPCFYDEQQLCLCQEMNQERLSNCFNFDHNSSLNCDGKSDCENEGQCFQENSKKCRKYLLCRCPDCYYGARCQLSTSGYSLSLDVILGYHIYPNINFFNQPRAILVSSILSTIIIIGGFINGFLSLITFKNKKTRESGSGIYLLCSSIITLITMIIFSLKFWILVISHMGVIKNESFLSIHCTLIDFFLRLCLTMDQWLTAFVSIERAFITIKGINFNQKKAKLVSKWIIFSIFLMTFITNIHDPIHRTSYEENDDDEKRFWCTVIYSSAIRIIDYTINIFHFIVPIIINIVSAIIIIATKIRQKLAIKNRENHAGIMKEQIREHKSLLIGPCVLITLAIPRLIILFASGCMKSANDSWLFLIGYFISLIPPTLTFILFVLPSTIFKQEFRKAFSHYLNIIRRRR